MMTYYPSVQKTTVHAFLVALLFGFNSVQAANRVESEMVRIAAGGFVMGCQDGRDTECDAAEKPAHRVNIKTFEIGKYEVTQGQWKAVMGENPSKSKSCGDNCPVENVSWNDIQNFIQKLNAQTGKQYRLPSEAEWEYACRAGKDTNYCGSDNVDAVAWYAKNSLAVSMIMGDGKTVNPVGGKQANAWGLYDMSGNVLEWVQDDEFNSYSGAPTDGSAWTGGKRKVLRGGSWSHDPLGVRAASRNFGPPSASHEIVGFRLARTIP